MVIRSAGLLALALRAVVASPYIFTPIEACSGCPTAVFGISNSGILVGHVTDASGIHAYFGQPGSYTFFDVPGAILTEAVSINDAGVIGGDSFDAAFNIRAFRREADGTLNPVAPVPGYAYMNGGNFNNAGITVGNVSNDLSGPFYGFIRQGGATTFPVQFPGAHVTQLSNANNAGVVAGYYQDTLFSTPHGFLYQPDGTFVPFEVPGAVGTQLYGINNSGHVSGGYFDAGGRIHGFIYANGQFTTIDFTGPNTMVFGLNDRDQVTGVSFPDGGFFTGPYSGFVASPVPEPSTFLLLAAGGGAILFERLRQRI
jgi:hypothetical protein